MNQIVKPPFVGQTDGNWTWDGTRWVCNSGCDDGGGFPPFGPPVFSGPVNQPPWYPGANGGVSFGSVAPPNPVRGHFWWDGITLWLFDGAAWVGFSPSSGGIPGPSPAPGSGVYQVSTFTTPGTFSYTVPANAVTTTTFKFHLQGGGGGGGGASAAAQFNGQGGGGGEYKQIALIGPPAGTIVACTVGGPGGAGSSAGTKGGNGGPTQMSIANTNTLVIANGGYGGWGSPSASGTNNSTEGLGGGNGTLSPGTANVQLVLSVPGGDAHLPSPSDWGNPGGDSFMGSGQPGFDTSVGWLDTTDPRGYGAGGRGSFNDAVPGGAGIGGIMIIERINA